MLQVCKLSIANNSDVQQHIWGRFHVGTAETIPASELVDTTGAGDGFIGGVMYGNSLETVFYVVYSALALKSTVNRRRALELLAHNLIIIISLSVWQQFWLVCLLQKCLLLEPQW